MSKVLALRPVLDFLDFVLIRNATIKSAFVSNYGSIWSGEDKLLGRYGSSDILQLLEDAMYDL